MKAFRSGHGRPRRVLASVLAVIAALSGCTSLSTEVAVSQFNLRPTDIRQSNTLDDALARGDYRRALEIGRTMTTVAGKDVVGLARAEIAAGRFADARVRLLRALESRVAERRDILWELSQAAYLSNDFAQAHRWAVEARSAGTGVMDWHMEFLSALARTQAYRSSGARTTSVAMLHELPSVPRVEVVINDQDPVAGFVDSGANVSIASETLARELGLQSLGTFRATFYGLTRKPIQVRFALIDSLRIGEVVIEAVPVAVMPDDELHFFVREADPFRADLLLGATLLKEFRLTFDYGESRLGIDVLEPERSPANDQNMFYVDSRPFVHATINRKGWYPFLLDTGSEITFLNANRLNITEVPGVPKPHKSVLQGLGGSVRRGTRLDGVSIGVDHWAGLFKHLPLYDDDRSGAVGIVGQNFLRHFTVIVDFGRMRVDLHRR